jgi:uncharacterized protein YgiM (DUF1202 family)
MKKIILISLLCLISAVWVSAQKRGDTMYVNIQKASLKTSTGFFAGTAGTLAYGDQVKVLEVKGKWLQVQSASGASVKGWIATASLTSKRITQGSNTVSSKELAMAGKGFSEEVEQQYKTDKNLNYTGVDEVEKIVVPDEDLLAFIEEGHLAKGE